MDFAKAFLSSTLCLEIGYNKNIRGTKTVNAFNLVSEDPVYAFQHLTANRLNKKLTNVKVGNSISSTEARNILVVSQWKSGSSFIGRLLNSYPGTFYSYEPLHEVDPRKRFVDDEQAVTLVSNMFRCQPGQDYLNKVKKQHGWPFNLHNFRLRDVCYSFSAIPLVS